MARPNTTDLIYRWFADTRQFERGTKRAGGALGDLQGFAKKAGAAVIGAFSVQAISQWTQQAIQMASAAEEVDSKFTSVFGIAQDLNDALREWGDVAGVTETQAKDMAATFGNLAQAQGFTLQESKDMALAVAELAGDMGSFNDMDPAMVFDDLNKALLTTEREGMKKYGIAVTETEVKQRALAIAMEDGRTEVTQQDRALASLEIVTKQAGKAVGDLERTSDSTANKQRQLTASIEEQQEEIGRKLLPAYDSWLSVANAAVPALDAVAQSVEDQTQVIDTSKPIHERFLGWLITLSPAAMLARQGIRALKDETDEAGLTFQEFADTQGIISDALLKRSIPSMNDTAEAAKELAEANRAIEDSVNRLKSALSGDLFKDYRESLRITLLLAGGNVEDAGPADLDPATGLPWAISNAQTLADRLNPTD